LTLSRDALSLVQRLVPFDFVWPCMLTMPRDCAGSIQFEKKLTWLQQ
jgi:hypothetical protein